VSWTDAYTFDDPFEDLRDEEGARLANALLVELGREVAPGHPLHGRVCRVIAKELPQDEAVVVAGEDVALVHLTWSRRAESLPSPTSVFLESPVAFAELIKYRY